MTKKDLKKATEINDTIAKINKIRLPGEITDVNLTRDDGVVTIWDGSVKVDRNVSFHVSGTSDNCNRYYIKIGDLNLTAEEGTKLINVIRCILSDREALLEKQFVNI